MNEDKRTVENLRRERALGDADKKKAQAMRARQGVDREEDRSTTSSSYRGEFGETINRGLEEGVSLIDPKGLRDRLDQVVVLDLRPAEEFARDNARIEGSLRFAVGRSEAMLGLSRQTPCVLVCGMWQEETCVETARSMRRQGFQDVSVLRGGWEAWRQAGFPVERAEE